MFFNWSFGSLLEGEALALFTHLSEIIIVVLSAKAAGHLILNKIKTFEDKILDAILEILIGLICISYLLFASIQLHIVSQLFLNLFLAALFLLALTTVKGLIRFVREVPKLAPLEYTVLGFVTLYFVFEICLSHLPPVARDELIYHLEIPKVWLKSGGAVLFKDNIYAYFPQLCENYFLLALGTVGVAGAKLFHLASGGLLALAIFAYLHRKSVGYTAIWGVLLFLSIPSVMVVMSWAYVDLTFALFAFIAFLCLCEFINTHAWRWIYLAGVMLGGACCVKYTGIQLTLLMGVVVAFHSRKRFQTALKAFAFLVLIAFGLSIPYFIRNYLVTGWPLYPFELLNLPINPELNWDSTRSGLYMMWLQAFGVPLDQMTIWHTLVAPIKAFILGRFNSPLHYEGMLNSVFLITPFLWIKKRDDTLKPWAFFVLIFIYYWAFTTKQIRFLIPVLPMMSVLLAEGIGRHNMRWLNALVALSVLVSLCFGIKEIGAKRPHDYLLSKVDQETYLASQIRVYTTYRDSNGLDGDGKLFLINMKNYGYYLDRDWEADFIFEMYRIENLLMQDPKPDVVAEFFRSREIEYIMVNFKTIQDKHYGMDPKALKLLVVYLKSHAEITHRYKEYVIFKIIK